MGSLELHVLNTSMPEFFVSSLRRKNIDDEDNSLGFLESREHLAIRQLSYMPSCVMMTGDFGIVKHKIEELKYKKQEQVVNYEGDSDIDTVLAFCICLAIPDRKVIDQEMISAIDVLVRSFPKCFSMNNMSGAEPLKDFLKIHLGKEVLVAVW